MPCWYFERKEIKNSPSFRDGIDTATENRYRREGARFIIDAGTKMGLYPFILRNVLHEHACSILRMQIDVVYTNFDCSCNCGLFIIIP